MVEARAVVYVEVNIARGRRSALLLHPTWLKIVEGVRGPGHTWMAALMAALLHRRSWIVANLLSVHRVLIHCGPRVRRQCNWVKLVAGRRSVGTTRERPSAGPVGIVVVVAAVPVI
jgi:hypothetical protein